MSQKLTQKAGKEGKIKEDTERYFYFNFNELDKKLRIDAHLQFCPFTI